MPRMTISLPDWIAEDIVGGTKNRSGRIVELLMKGYIAEQAKRNRNLLRPIQKSKGTKAYFGTKSRDISLYETPWGILEVQGERTSLDIDCDKL